MVREGGEWIHAGGPDIARQDSRSVWWDITPPIAVPNVRRGGEDGRGGVQSAMNDPHVFFASHEMESMGTWCF